jgi:tetratricopeptide (TPR) repeat protein
MYLKQQELSSKSRALFDEGKQYLMDKSYKEAIKAFSLSLKCHPNNKDAKYYRAICFLDSDNTRKCI